jgi:hypothetical protein
MRDLKGGIFGRDEIACVAVAFDSLQTGSAVFVLSASR